MMQRLYTTASNPVGICYSLLARQLFSIMIYSSSTCFTSVGSSRTSLHQKKKSVSAKAINSLQDPTRPNIIVFYGDGKLGSGNQLHQRTVPIKGLREACERSYEVIEVDEHRSSSICPVCGT